MNLVNCIRRFLPIIKNKNILPTNISRTKMLYKAEQRIHTISRFMPFPSHTTTAKSVLFGFSLLSFFGLDEEIDSELKLINTIKRGLLYLQVKF